MKNEKNASERAKLLAKKNKLHDDIFQLKKIQFMKNDSTDINNLIKRKMFEYRLVCEKLK